MTPRRLLAGAALLACAALSTTAVPVPPRRGGRGARGRRPAGRARGRGADADSRPGVRPRPTPEPAPSRAPADARARRAHRQHRHGRRPAVARHGVAGRGDADADRHRARSLRLRPDVRRGQAARRAGADVAICHEEVPFALPGQAAAELPGLRRAAAGRAVDREHGLRRLHDGVQPLRRPAAGRGWSTPPTCSSANGVAHVGTFRSPAERRRPVILTTDEGVRVGVVAGAYGLNGFPLPEGRPVVGLALGRRQPARPGPRRPRGRRRHRRGAPPRRQRVRPPAQRRPGRPRRAAHPLPRRRPRPRRARPRRPADHAGQRDVGRLRHGQPGRPAGDVPRRHLRGHHRAVRLRASSPTAASRSVARPTCRSPGTCTATADRSASGGSSTTSAAGTGDRATLLAHRASVREAVHGLGLRRVCWSVERRPRRSSTSAIPTQPATPSRSSSKSPRPPPP